MTASHPQPYLIGIWAASMLDATELVNDYMMADSVIQFVPSKPSGFWIMLRVTGDQHDTLRSAGANAKPKWAFLP